MKRIAPLVVTLAAMFSFLLATPKQASQKNYRPAVQEYVLENGMKVLMLVKPGVPRVVCHIYYKVGSINERPGITGLAHLHEHMMFKGTRMMGVSDFEKDDALNQRIDSLMEQVYRERFWKQKGDAAKADALEKEAEALMKEEKQYIIKDHLWETLMRNGGTGLNASTGNESTGYYVTLPSNKVELQMLLEADRMQNAYYREFYSEKNVVMEERRLSENSPGSLFDEQVNSVFYAASPYSWDVIGWMDDLRKVTRKDLAEFHNRYYVPNNAVAVYVGDFDPQKLLTLVKKYFGPIPKGPENEPIRTYEPAQMCEKRVYGKGPAATRVDMYFHAPADGQQDSDALSLLGGILSGETGRLFKSLVKEQDLTARVSARYDAMWYAGQFSVGAFPKVQKGVTPEKMEAALWEQIEKVKREGVTEVELQKVKNNTEARLTRMLQQPMFLAMMLGREELNRGWASMFDDIESMKKVTVEDVRKAAEKYLVRDNVTVAVYTREAGK